MVDKKYKFIEHMADFELEVRGENQEELFTQAVLGMMEFLFGPKEIEKGENGQVVQQRITLTSDDEKILLVDFLSELLSLVDIHNACFTEFKFIKILPNELEVEVVGHQAQAQDEIKAVTYHRLEVEKQADDGWRARIVFDI